MVLQKTINKLNSKESSMECETIEKNHELIVGEKKKIRTRLSLSRIVELNGRLTDEQRQAVRSIGFGALLDLKCSLLKHNLCKWIVDNFDHSSMTLDLHGRKLEINADDVKQILGLPNCGSPVPTNGQNDEIMDELFSSFSNKELISLVKLRDELIKCQSHGDHFKRMHCIYIVGYLLCPSIEHGVKKDVLHAIKDVNAIATYNWAQYVLDSLAAGIVHSRDANLKYVSGCVFLLMIFFLEHVSLSSTSAQDHDLNPSIGYWTNEKVSEKLTKLRLRGGYSSPKAYVVDELKLQEENKEEKNQENEEEKKEEKNEEKKEEKREEKNEEGERFEYRLSHIEKDVQEIKKDVHDIKNLLNLIWGSLREKRNDDNEDGAADGPKDREGAADKAKDREGARDGAADRPEGGAADGALDGVGVAVELDFDMNEQAQSENESSKRREELAF